MFEVHVKNNVVVLNKNKQMELPAAKLSDMRHTHQLCDAAWGCTFSPLQENRQIILIVFWTISYVIQEAALASACRLKCNTKYYDDKINGHTRACHSVSFSFCPYVCKCVSRFDYIAETKRHQKDSKIWNHINCDSHKQNSLTSKKSKKI